MGSFHLQAKEKDEEKILNRATDCHSIRTTSFFCSLLTSETRKGGALSLIGAQPKKDRTNWGSALTSGVDGAMARLGASPPGRGGFETRCRQLHLSVIAWVFISLSGDKLACLNGAYNLSGKVAIWGKSFEIHTYKIQEWLATKRDICKIAL